MNLSEVLDRSRELVRSRGLDPAFAAVQAVDELAEGLSESIDEERLIAEANLELSGFGVIQPFLDDPSQLPLLVATKVQELSTPWQKSAEHRFSCQPCEAGGLATLEIAVGNALAVQVAGLEPG